MKTLLFLLLSIFGLQTPGRDSTLIALRKKEIATNQLLKQAKQLIVLAKIADKKNLVRVYNDKWPDKTEYNYNVLKDAAGKVIMIAQIPFSQSGDWMLSYRHYFDDNGNTYCFKKDESLFDDSVKDGVVLETITKFYDNSFKAISSKSLLTGMHEKPLKRKRTEFGFRNDKYVIYRNVSDCLKAYGIQL